MNVSRAIVRSFSSSVKRSAEERKLAPGYLEIRNKYKHFQLDNGLLIHQRGSTNDYVMFALTAVVNLVGIAMAVDMYYRLAFNKK
ncbi:UNVERIFIED_CONTAM: hypothetical protein RMT77_015367 [Armadillidium vulgare]